MRKFRTQSPVNCSYNDLELNLQKKKKKAGEIDDHTSRPCTLSGRYSRHRCRTGRRNGGPKGRDAPRETIPSTPDACPAPTGPCVGRTRTCDGVRFSSRWDRSELYFDANSFYIFFFNRATGIFFFFLRFYERSVVFRRQRITRYLPTRSTT